MRIVPDTKRLSNIGTISKVQGINGEVLVIANRVIEAQLLKTELVFILIDGLPVPFFVSYCEERNDTVLLLKLDEIVSRNQAEEIVGCDVMIEETRKPGRRKKITSSASVINYEVIDIKLGPIGTIKSVIDHQSNPLLQIMNKQKEILIPLHEDIIIEINDSAKTITINAPEGLIEMYMED